MCFISTILLVLGGLKVCIYVVGIMLLHWGMEYIDIWIYSRARRRALKNQSMPGVLNNSGLFELSQIGRLSLR